MGSAARRRKESDGADGPPPEVLRNLVEQYEALRVLQARADDAEVRRRLEDVEYTLCVSTGTREVDRALTVVRRTLREDDARQGSALGG
ncbi:hypothetical protein VR41_01210 [Streptomyces sp. NRRL B-1568]|nr:hypothetical protein VR41_01210 [Streptomyces sp. NRRL B-1568]